jgi:hypothetical protein
LKEPDNNNNDNNNASAEEEEEQQQPEPTTIKPTFQTASELLQKKQQSDPPKQSATTSKRNTVFDDYDGPLGSRLSQHQKHLAEGYCLICTLTKPREKWRKLTPAQIARNPFAYYCKVCNTMLSIGTEFLAGMKSLDEMQLISLTDEEIEIIKNKDSIIYEKLIKFREPILSKEGN